MKGRLFNLFAALSLVMCVTSVGMWIRSYFAGDSFGLSRFIIDPRDATGFCYQSSGVVTGGGQVAFGTKYSPTFWPRPPRVFRESSRWFCGWNSGGLVKFQLLHLSPGPAPDWGYLGFDIRSDSDRLFCPQWFVFVPYWFLTLTFAAAPIYASLANPRWRRDRRLRSGLCLVCGYDLTGNVSGVCPECGTAVDASISEKRGIQT